MPRYMMIVQYDGTKFSGWQAQKNAKTIAGTLNKVLSDLMGYEITVYGSGRTDSGVHATGQTAHFDVRELMDTENVLKEANDKLPDSIAIKTLQRVNDRFHARHHAVSRTYVYQLSKEKQTFLRNYVWVPERLDTPDKLFDVMLHYKGFHDFASFSAEKDKDISTKVDIIQADISLSGELILLRFVGSHFLRSMVRRLVGTAVGCANGLFSIDDIDRFLRETSKEPSRFTAPPLGLFLESVSYNNGDNFQNNIVPPIISSLS